MNSPPTSQDDFPFSAGYALFMNGPSEGERRTRSTYHDTPLYWRQTCGSYLITHHPFISCHSEYPALTYLPAGTQEVSYPSGYPGSPHYDPSETFYDQLHTLDSHYHTNDLPSMVFAAPAQTLFGDMHTNQPTPSSACAPSGTTPNILTNTPVVSTVTPASTAAPSTATAQVTTQRRLGCPMCPKTFDRPTRAEACQNSHLGWKVYVCQGACGDTTCAAAYFSIENLHRHTRALANRKVTCPRCSKPILKQNIARHKASCV